MWPDGIDRVVLDEVDSTMAEAARRAPHLTQPVWILAYRQTAGVGRRGRPWSHPAGNLAATYLTRVTAPPETIALTSFQASLALYETLAEFVSKDRIALKWPNDVLLDNGKVAGILLESGSAKGQISWLSVGIGLNLISAPSLDQVEPGAVLPVSLDIDMPVEDVLTRLAFHFDRIGRIWNDTGFDTIRRKWLANAARLGEVITARLPKEDIIGTFDTVDENGYLVLKTAKGPRRIAAAEVHF